MDVDLKGLLPRLVFNHASALNVRVMGFGLPPALTVGIFGGMHSEPITAREWGFQGKLLKVEVLEVTVASGATARREVIRHPGAAVVLARLPDGRFVFVRQYRKAVEQLMLEVIAGTREEGEAPEQCARREVLEECGHPVVSIQSLGLTYPAPGYTDECLFLFLADVASVAQPLRTDADEFLDVVYLTEDDIDREIASAGIVDAKTITAWHLYRQKQL